MDMATAAILLVLVLLSAIWLSQNWGTLAAQLRALFGRAPAGRIDIPDIKSAPPEASDKSLRADAAAGRHKAKRHTVVPHQARGR